VFHIQDIPEDGKKLSCTFAEIVADRQQCAVSDGIDSNSRTGVLNHKSPKKGPTGGATRCVARTAGA
jgi:hypothetical protein